MPTLDATLADVRDVEGWLTDDQIRTLWKQASVLRPPARVVEIGSYRGRSTIVLARALDPATELVAIDPHAGNDRGPQEFEGFADEAESDHRIFLANLEKAGVDGRVRYVRRSSQDALDEVEGTVDLLFIDGAHRFRPARADIAGWGPKVAEGGTMLVHDAWSAIGVSLALLLEVAFGAEFEYLGRVGTLAQYRRRRLSLWERARNGARHLAELPWFARNLVIKAATLLRLRRVVELFGHEYGVWPH